MTSRRSFLKASVAVASGLILPSWLEHAERFIQLESKPYIERPPIPKHTLYAAQWDYDGYELFLGNPLAEPELDLTWEEFIERYTVGQDEYEWRQDTEDNPPALHDKVDESLVIYHWEYVQCPGRKAYRFLEGIDLGKELNKGDSGSINFYDGFSPANDCQVVAASDLLSLSLLQQRLNQIDNATAIEIIRI